MIFKDYDWRADWLMKLSYMPQRIAVTDGDDTLWEDIRGPVLDRFGAVDSDGNQKALRYQKVNKVKRGKPGLTNGERLLLDYWSAFVGHPYQQRLAEVIQFAVENCPLLPGSRDYVDTLHSQGAGLAMISNGAYQIADGVIEGHKLNIPLMANWFVDGAPLIQYIDPVMERVDKGLLINMAHEAGKEILFFSGDAFPDIEGAAATAALGGLVLSRGPQLTDWCKANLLPEQWMEFTDFRQVMATRQFQQRVVRA